MNGLEGKQKTGDKRDKSENHSHEHSELKNALENSGHGLTPQYSVAPIMYDPDFLFNRVGAVQGARLAT